MTLPQQVEAKSPDSENRGTGRRPQQPSSPNIEAVQAKAECVVQGLVEKGGRVKATNASSSFSLVRSWFREKSRGSSLWSPKPES